MALYDLRGLLKVELSDKVLWQLFVFVEVMLTRFRRVRKMRKTTVGYVMCLSVFPHATTRLTLDGFSWYLGFYCFSKTYRENSISILTRMTGTLYEDLCAFMIVTSWFLGIRNVSDKHVQKIIAQIFFNFFRKSCRLWYYVEKYCTFRQATDDNLAHAHWMLNG